MLPYPRWRSDILGMKLGLLLVSFCNQGQQDNIKKVRRALTQGPRGTKQKSSLDSLGNVTLIFRILRPSVYVDTWSKLKVFANITSPVPLTSVRGVLPLAPIVNTTPLSDLK